LENSYKNTINPIDIELGQLVQILDGIFGGYGNAVCIFNIECRAIYCNQEFISKYDQLYTNSNSPFDTTESLSLKQLFPDSYPKWEESILAAFESGPVQFTYEARDSFCEYNLYSTNIAGNRICISIGVDFSQWNNIANHNAEKERDLIDKNTTKDRIFSIIAHDLKNPVGTLEQVSKVLFYDFDSFSKEDFKDYIEDIYKTSKSAADLLETLLNWAHVQKGTAQFDPSDTSLRLIAEKCSELLSIKARRKNIRLNNDIDQSLFAYADPKMVYTVMRNLVTNSLKFTENGGQVSIGAKPTEGYVLVEIQDTGVGMSKEKAAELFSVNKIESTEGTDNEAGTGLGLVLCKDFVEMHGGRIWAESELNKGTSVFFTLPISDQQS